jgi:hypothetical protein
VTLCGGFRDCVVSRKAENDWSDTLQTMTRTEIILDAVFAISDTVENRASIHYHEPIRRIDCGLFDVISVRDSLIPEFERQEFIRAMPTIY